MPIKTISKAINAGKGPDSAESDPDAIADAIQKVAAGMQKLRSSRLNERAVIVLIKDASGLSVGDIRKVLSAAENLEGLYLKPRRRKESR